MVISLILIYIAGHAVQNNWNYFTMYQFNWDVKMVGISLGIIGLFGRFGTRFTHQVD